MGFNSALNIYFVASTLGYLVGAALFARAALKDGRRPAQIAKVLGLAIGASLFGAKLFHVLFEARGHMMPDGQWAQGVWDLLSADPWHWLRLNDPGYVLYGGLLFGLLATFKYWDYTDYATKGLALGLCIGRVGCFFTGCCYGIADLPVQLFEAGFAGWLFLKVDRFEELLWRYSLWRFGIEFLRADASRGIWGLGLSTSQWISLGILGVLAGTRLTSALKSSQIPRTRIQT